MFTPTTKRRTLAIAAAASTVLLAVTGCAASKNSPQGDDDAARGGTLTIALDKGPTTLDPANMEQSTNPFAQPAYDALINVDDKGELHPGLATEWGFTDDENKVFEITLREDVTFSDGAALDADALIANLEHFDTGKSNVISLVNGGQYEKVDEDTVRITWETPHPLAPQAFTQRMVAGMIASPDAITEDPAGLATGTAGTGPYVLDSDKTVTSSKYVYTARDDYWDPESIHWDEIVINVMENPEQRLNALKTGEADYVLGDMSTVGAAESDDVQVLSAPTIVYGVSLLDREGELGTPLADVRVRQAINYALDNETIAQSLLGEYGFPTEQTIVPSVSGYVKDLKGHYSFDQDKAKALLAEAGYPDGFTLPVVSSTSAPAALLSQVVVEQLAQVGITVELDARQGADYFEGMTSGTFPAAMIGYGSQPLPMEYDGLFGPNAVFNPLGSQSDTIDDNMSEALVTSDDEAEKYYQAVVTELVEDAWFAPVVFAPVFYFASSDLAPISITEARPQAPILEITSAE